MTYNQMNMRRSHRVSVQQLQHFACWAIIRNRIRGWFQTVPAVTPGLICRESSSQVAILLLRVLLFVEAVGAVLPHVDYHPRDALAGHGVNTTPVHIGYLSVGGHSLDDRSTVGVVWCVFAEEGAEDGSRCVGVLGVGGGGEGDFIDESRARR